eukprot:2706117-Amphidinium_carterae.2
MCCAFVSNPWVATESWVHNGSSEIVQSWIKTGGIYFGFVRARIWGKVTLSYKNHGCITPWLSCIVSALARWTASTAACIITTGSTTGEVDKLHTD